MTPREYDQPVPVFAQSAPGPEGEVHVPGTAYRPAPCGTPALAMSAKPQVIGALVQKCSPELVVPYCPGAYNGADRSPAGLTVVEIGRCGRVLQVCAGVPGLLLYHPVLHDPAGVVVALPWPFVAVTLTASACPTSLEPTA